jgi:hypothetical protein
MRGRSVKGSGRSEGQLLVKRPAQFPPECFSPKTQTNLANSTGYFEEHHYAGDYWPMVLISEANALSSWESIIRQKSRRSANG